MGSIANRTFNDWCRLNVTLKISYIANAKSFLFIVEKFPDIRLSAVCQILSGQVGNKYLTYSPYQPPFLHPAYQKQGPELVSPL
jgi:hypothetical protein